MLRFPAEVMGPLRAAYEGTPVCVTGGTGFIGAHLVDTLFGLGATVRVIDDLSNSDAGAVSELLEVDPERVRFVHGSILDPEALGEAVDGATVVFHLAAVGSVPRSVEEPARSWEVNATGTLRVLERARAGGARRVVYAASSSAYGETEQLPKVETMTPSPTSPYGASKLAGEHLCAAWSRTYGLDTASLRYFNIFGPRQPAGSAYAAVIPAFIERLCDGRPPVIFGDGKHTRDFTYVANAVYATLLAGSSRGLLKGGVFNIGTGRRVTLLELASLLTDRIVGAGEERPGPELREPRVGDIRHSLADIGRARSVLKYEPIYSLEDGLDATVRWARDDCASSRGG